jgi:hypothetical protein
MKKLVAFLGLIGLFMRGRAQSFAEWFEQNKTELKYLREQLTALEEDDGILEEGYAIDETGLKRIEGNKQADLDVHRAYFSGLIVVNKALLADPRANGIFVLTTETEKLIERTKEIVDSSPKIQTGFDAVSQYFTERCATDLARLAELLETGVLMLTDGERLARLKGLYSEAKTLNDMAWTTWRDARYYANYEGL